MTNEQAKRLAHRIIDTWPGHVIKAHVWTEVLTDLDYNVALGVYEHLRDTDERPPPIARFRAIYRTVTPDYGWQEPADTGPIIDPAIGRQVARRAYIEDCLAHGRTPNLVWFDYVNGLVG